MLDRADKLMEELRRTPIVEVFGVLEASGAGGTKGTGEDWTLCFAFDGWKFPNGVVQNRKLTIRKPVSHEELKIAMKQIRPFDVLHIQARVAEENCFGTPQGLLVNIIRKGVADADLQQHLAELQKPVTFRDERFGVFTLDRRANWFEAVVRWESTDIKLHLQLGEGGRPP